ncbi:MAG TPA: 3-hydroxyacyl-CoA dehydrogenase [Symbiobacteriaceae bacterium]|nr:3-hydroxyacyl-CoA dehydrogenase [Symbiobacteriaceae bacterium]
MGVVGAGAMGSGLAQVAALAGLDVLLYDIADKALEAGLGRIRSGLDRLVQRGKLAPDERDAALGRITTTKTLGDFLDLEFIVEAAPEVMDLKKEIFQKLDHICRPGTILATNTSSLSVTEIAELTYRPDRVCGMHFFNPVPLMKLVEVVRGAQTSDETLRRTTELAERLGKTPVQVKDTPGFIVNRVARPFPGEALRLVGENVASPRQVDRVAKLAGGFRMGPFELMDLVGMDVNFAVNYSVFEQFYFEPRFRPHPLQAQMVKANRLGRKTGQGWYRYEGDQAVDGPEGATFAGNPMPRVDGLKRVYIQGDPSLAGLAMDTGYEVVDDPAVADLVLVEASRMTTTEIAAGMPDPARVVGFGGVPAVATRMLVEVAPGLRTEPRAWELAVAFFHSVGRDTEVIHDGPGLILPRLLACLANEAAFALMEGVASAPGIDTAMLLGVNYPHGPLEWADEIGPDVILGVLEHLHRFTGDDRYRPCPYLRRLVVAGARFADDVH